MCLYPKLIKNRRYTANKKNGGNIPPLPLVEVNGKMMKDLRVLEVPVKCGKCIECRKQEARKWQIRLYEEVRTRHDGIFVTLTFSNESIKELGKETSLTGYNRDNEIATIGMRRFLERWRKKYKKSIRHWTITELGHNGTENVHIHGIMWTDKNPKEIERIWEYGYVWLSTDHNGYVNDETVSYITKYVHKQDKIHTEYKPKVLTSPGIGKGYTDRIDSQKHKYKEGETNELYRNRQGYKMALPTYYKNNIFTEEEKEKLWIEKLNKNERYVLGQKIDISRTDEQYYETVKYARKLNKELGYGDDAINWEKRKYEEERRNINYMKRIMKAQRNSPSAGGKKR